jgi:hypothetical protein
MNNSDDAVTTVEPVNRVESGRDEELEFRELRVEPAQPPLRLIFNEPFEYDGQKYAHLTFDWDSLIGKDFQRAEKTFTKLYKADKNEVVLPEMKHLYHTILAAQVANVPPGLIMKLPRRYYIAVRNEALKSCGSSPDEDKV